MTKATMEDKLGACCLTTATVLERPALVAGVVVEGANGFGRLDIQFTSIGLDNHMTEGVGVMILRAALEQTIEKACECDICGQMAARLADALKVLERDTPDEAHGVVVH